MKNTITNMRGPFKVRVRKIDTGYIPPYEVDQYQCPMCRVWFSSYLGNTGNVLQHITILAKQEAIAKCLGETRKIPHFNFWKKNTKPVFHLSKPRIWAI